jgi:hypothetical protein
MTDPARLTMLRPDVADQHEQHPDATCLLAPDGDTCCQQPATHRVELTPMPGYDEGPVTFACAEHVDRYRGHPAVASIREVQRHAP